MKFGSRMARPSQAPSSKDTSSHAKIATVFSDENLSRRLTHTKQAMPGLVDRERFRNTTYIGRVIILPTCGQLFKLNSVRGVTIDFIRAHEDKNRVCRAAPRCFQ